MPRDYKVYFEDILEAAGKIQKFTDKNKLPLLEEQIRRLLRG